MVFENPKGFGVERYTIKTPHECRVEFREIIESYVDYE